ncbi:unnamed protein product [Peronospora farinosa]|uniref:J domain-containing protein n=1 Tax=Peronospora farinosa TaxID=134698 RepID=A0AAV0SU14_9STRA|nr:unnamed protein product [Peronospora farinosa]CAI5707094.1 unnamed protein product [Peronospora farinosa]
MTKTRRHIPLLLLLLLHLLAFVSNAQMFGFDFGGGHDEHHDHVHEHDHVDFYETLGLSMEATDTEIKKAYRKLSLKYHPDKNKGDENAESRFHEISRAYEVLSDPQKRQVFDLEGFEGLEREEQSSGRPSSPFDAFFGGGGKQRGPDAGVDVSVTLEELYNGAEKKAQFARNVICRKCRGTGAKGGKTMTCKKCGGTGHILVNQKMGPGFTVQMQQPCPKCSGRGKTFKKACPVCQGHKVVKENKVLTAAIERGMPSAHEIVFERESEQRPGMMPGNVIFRLQQVPHKRFRRAGDDLHYNLMISLEEALLGYKKPMKHLDDRTVVLSNSHVTTPFEVRIVEGEGMPVHNYPSQLGNLHVHHEIRFPTKLSVEQKELVKKLLPEDSATAKQLIETDRTQWQLYSDADGATPMNEATYRVLKKVAGVDISFLKGSDEHACASIVVLDYPSQTVLYEAFTYVSLPAPYITGFLAFREVPALRKLYSDLCHRCPDLVPDVTLVDGNGVLHPQGFGLASHFGVLENVPTIGVGKTFLHVDGLTKTDVKNLMAKAREENHDVVKLTGRSGKVWGAALCGTAGVKNPVYVSVGNMLSLDTSLAIAQACSQYRIPEPIRQADLRSREVVRQWESAGAVNTTLDLFHVHPLPAHCF